MNKKIIVVYMVVCFAIVGCGNKNENTIKFDVDNKENYTGFDKIKDYTNAKEAVADGCYVKDGDVFKGTKHWKKFLDKASNSDDAQLRIVILSDDGISEYIDLFYHNELYYAFKSETDDLSVKGYQYLLVLENSKIINNKTAYAVVLSNDDTLTFANIINNLTSSKSIVINEPYKIIFQGMKSV